MKRRHSSALATRPLLATLLLVVLSTHGAPPALGYGTGDASPPPHVEGAPSPPPEPAPNSSGHAQGTIAPEPPTTQQHTPATEPPLKSTEGAPPPQAADGSSAALRAPTRGDGASGRMRKLGLGRTR
eukprot:3184699-Prymnesium_polylepis.1